MNEKEKLILLDYSKLNELKIELEQKLSDESLLRRKAEIEISGEKRKMLILPREKVFLKKLSCVLALCYVW